MSIRGQAWGFNVQFLGMGAVLCLLLAWLASCQRTRCRHGFLLAGRISDLKMFASSGSPCSARGVVFDTVDRSGHRSGGSLLLLCSPCPARGVAFDTVDRSGRRSGGRL